ncbi:MAG: hypothetical protein Q4P36_03485 [Bowdeniella nasicola]|nr:hypothetical protein [Bowdeniella nasicola]
MRWLRRNWAWLLALPLALGAAGFASCHRLIEIYWPSEPTAPVTVSGATAHYVSEFVNAGATYARDIDVTFQGARHVETHGGLRAVEGATLWAFDFTLAAGPKVIADGCTVVALDERGRQYFPRAATTVDPSEPRDLSVPCLPPDAEGPTIDYFSGTVIDSRLERPPQWDTTLVVAIPDGIEPTAVRIWWDLPVYAEFPLP